MECHRQRIINIFSVLTTLSSIVSHCFSYDIHPFFPSRPIHIQAPAPPPNIIIIISSATHCYHPNIRELCKFMQSSTQNCQLHLVFRCELKEREKGKLSNSWVFSDTQKKEEAREVSTLLLLSSVWCVHSTGSSFNKKVRRDKVRFNFQVFEKIKELRHFSVEVFRGLIDLRIQIWFTMNFLQGTRLNWLYLSRFAPLVCGERAMMNSGLWWEEVQEESWWGTDSFAARRRWKFPN